MADDTAAQTAPTTIEQIFGVRRSEYVPVAWSFVYFFCVLASYYVLRPVREAMAVGSGPDTIPWLFFGTFVAMMIAAPIFGWVASRYPRRRFLPWVYLFFIINILIFWVAFSRIVNAEGDHVWAGRIFFVWISIFNLFVVSVFWSFMADIYSRGQVRRLFGLITAGGSVGALAAGFGAEKLVIIIGFQNLFPIAASLLTVGVVCIVQLRHWVEHEHEGEVAQTVASSKPLGGNPLSGITHVFASKYFIAIAISSVIASLLGTALYMFAAELVEQEITGIDQRTAFFSAINKWTSLFSLIGQMFIVKHVVGRFGIGASLILLPIVSVVGFAVLAIDPVLTVVAVLTVVRRGLGFGFSKPTMDMLYSVVTPEEKYKVKNFIDTAIYRGGDLIGTWAIRFMSALGISGISWVMLPFAIIWGAVALFLGREYKRRDNLAKSGASA